MRYTWITLAGVLLAIFGVRAEEVRTVRIDSYPAFDYRLDVPGESPEIKYEPLTAVDSDTWYNSSYWIGSTNWCRVGRDWQHPGDNAASVRTFIAPKSGEVEITGEAAKYHVDPATDGVVVTIFQNDRQLWKAEIDGGDDRGWRFFIKVPVEKDDAIRFIVQKRGDIPCDTTRLDPVITYCDTPQAVYRASEDFTLDDATPWRYEAMPARDAVLREKPDGYGSDFGAMIQYEWLCDDKIAAGDTAGYLQAAARHLEKARLLLDDLADSLDDQTLDLLEARYDELLNKSQNITADDATGAEIFYAEVRGFKRKCAFANPLTRFGKMLFVKRVPTSYSHLVMQYFGWRARKGGGIFVLDEPGKSLACSDIFDGKLQEGNVLEPRLSYDAKQLVFSYVDLSSGKEYDPYKVYFDDEDDGFYHVWKGNVDGSGLTQVTSGSFDDITPNWMPDGRIVFSSTRRKGYARCFWWGFGRRWHVYTIHSMNSDGSDIKTLSWHDTNEWFPEVSHDGQIVYARWDYIDRDAVTHQNFWVMRPDGTNPRALWGNATPKPHCTFQAKPIPDSGKFLFTASAHHSITAGSIVMLDPSVGSDGMESLTRLTPEVPFPEAETTAISEYYESPQPLSEKYYLATYCRDRLHWEGETPNEVNALGIYLLDVFGNRELIYRDPEIGATNPIPLAARQAPPILPSQLPDNPPNWGEMSVTDVYQGLGPEVKRGDIKEIRVVQLFPKVTRDSTDPLIGAAGEENGRAILGTVPVESDGSAYFRVPAKTPFYLQAIDSQGNAYQTMRSLTYLQPGEKISCVGCHENRDSSAYSEPEHFAAGTTRPLAMQREVSIPDPGPWGNRPFSYSEAIQPILDAKCVSCHNAEKTEGGCDLTGRVIGEEGSRFPVSYAALTGVNGYQVNGEAVSPELVPRFPARNTIQMTEPGGKIGAIGSGLMKLLRGGHEEVELSDEELRAFAAWIDLNAIYIGTGEPDQRDRALAGLPLPMPEIQ
ncbi:MAG: PD40 domain-containing protein [Thermoguttaceae bacterium]|nr:PD40 domain-containing protein [Thermoguttaceae bacterium]